MDQREKDSFTELIVALEWLMTVHLDKEHDEYDDNYVRRHAGPIRLVGEEPEQCVEIGEIEVWYIDGSRACDNGLDIVDVCDSLGQDEYDYAAAVYRDGVIDSEIVDEPLSNDVLVLHKIAILPEYRGRKYGLRATRKIVETLGYRCATVVLRPTPLQFSEEPEWNERMGMSAFSTDEKTATEKLTAHWGALDLTPTKDPSIYFVRLE